MKYHGLKMEEVNDTMRHLWNKTYQGTGVTPRSDLCRALELIARRYRWYQDTF